VRFKEYVGLTLLWQIFCFVRCADTSWHRIGLEAHFPESAKLCRTTYKRSFGQLISEARSTSEKLFHTDRHPLLPNYP